MAMPKASNLVLAHSVNNRDSGSEIERSLGQGLYRSGKVQGGVRGGVNPALVGALMPAVADLGKLAVKEGIPWVVKAAKKGWNWLKGLFGKGLLRSGGLRQRYSNTDPTGIYHDMVVSQSQAPEDYMLPGANTKDIRRFNKLKGGFAPIDVPSLMERITTDQNFKDKLMRNSKKPHKFINTIFKNMNKKKAII
jgi:hypothetical protein